MRFSLALAMVLMGSLLFGQTIEIKPASLSFESVPPNISPAQEIAITNEGTDPITVAVAVSVGAPFTISENRCTKGIKPNTHCNVYITYTAATIGEVDNDTITVNYSGGTASATLSGEGVASIATWGHVQLDAGEDKDFKVGDSIGLFGQIGIVDKKMGYALPTGEQVTFSCSDASQTVTAPPTTLALCQGHCPADGGPPPYDVAYSAITPTEAGTWFCGISYPGDGILGAVVGGGPKHGYVVNPTSVGGSESERWPERETRNVGASDPTENR